MARSFFDAVPESFALLDIAEDRAEAFYTRTNGQKVRLAEMATPHLRSAWAKLSRECPGHPEIIPMADALAQREAADAAAQQETAT
ncbi:MAG: hypothetical protein ACHP84_03110 [Caulobacterales bacterium]